MWWPPAIVLTTVLVLAACEPEALPTPSPHTPLTPQPNWGLISVTPDRGPIGTRVLIRGSGCGNPGHPPYLSFTNEGVPGLTGTVGADDLKAIATDANDHFEADYVIPASLHGYQGRGGGAVTPGTYQFLSFPPTCASVFTVTVG